MIVALKDLKKTLPKGRRLLGIDHSKSILGLAVSNPDLTLATPLKTIRRSKFKEDVNILARICGEYGIGGFVIGLPLNMDGTEGPRSESVRHFADNLIQAKEVLGFDPLIAFYDETLSTYEARGLLEDAGVSKERRNNAIDQLAAQLVLQGALEKIK